MNAEPIPLRGLGIFCASLTLASACTSGSAGQSAVAPSPSPPSVLDNISTLPASSTSLRLPDRCSPVAVGRQLAQLLADVNVGNGPRAARHFAAGGLWEVYEHMNPPNGRAGGIGSVAAIIGFVRELRSRGENWTQGRLSSPVGSANLPEATGYGLTITVTTASRARTDGGKVAIDCKSGLITHMVGPVGHRG